MRPKPAMRQTMQKLDLNIESLSELTIFKSESHVHYVNHKQMLLKDAFTSFKSMTCHKPAVL